MTSPDPTDEPTPFRDAESWLAARGVQRDPLVVRPEPHPDDGRAPIGAREAVRLATETPAPPPAQVPEPTEEPGQLEDEVRKAVATCQRITAQAPQSEARLRAKLESRDLTRPVVDLALQRCRELRIVDDEAMAHALVDERRRKGHAPARIRKDLAARGLPDDVLDRALASADLEDPEAAAFAVARDRAARLRHLEPETAYRRLAGWLARRGYPDGLCRKVAREVVYADREQQRVAER